MVELFSRCNGRAPPEAMRCPYAGSVRDRFSNERSSMEGKLLMKHGIFQRKDQLIVS